MRNTCSAKNDSILISVYCSLLERLALQMKGYVRIGLTIDSECDGILELLSTRE